MALYAVASGLTERAICFEPEMRNFSLLKKNLRRNGLHSKIAAYCVGLASSKSNATLVTSADNFGDHRVFTPNELEGSDKYNSGHRNRSSIELETLDDMYSSRFNNSEIGFICLDVQGFELEVIRGGDRVFSKSPALMMELDPYLLEKRGAQSKNCTDIWQNITLSLLT